MKKRLTLIFLVLVAVHSPDASAQSSAARSRTGASLPPTCTPGGPNAAAATIVVNGTYYVCTAPNKWSAVHGSEGDNAWTSNNRFCGPIPWADVSCYGARAPAGGVPSTTANCLKGNNQVVIAASNTFQVNDGVTIYGCGATNAMGTPSGLKVTPSEPWGPADTRSPVTGPEGNSTYEYTIVARDIYGALTAPAPMFELKTGQASLGLQKAAISTLTRKNDRITVVTAEPNRLVVGALVEIEPKDSQQFGGWYNVAKVDSPRRCCSGRAKFRAHRRKQLSFCTRFEPRRGECRSANDNWYGDWSSQGAPQFGLSSGAGIYVNSASPGLYLMGTGNSLRGLNIVDQNPSGGTLLVADNAAPSNFDYVNFLTGAGGSATDYTGMAIILRDTTQTIANYHFNKITVSTGPDQVNDKSWTPSFWVAPAQHFGNNAIEVTMDRTSVNRRGIGWGGGDGGDASVGGVAGFVSNWSYRQGGIIPYFTCMACSEYAPLTFNDASQDTEGQPLEAALLVTPFSGYLGPRITAHYPTGGVQAPLFSGLRPSYADVDAIFSKASAFQNRDILYKTGGAFPFVYAPYATSDNYTGVYGSLYTVGMPMHGVGGYSWWFDLSVPTNVAAAAGTGGSVPPGTWVYAVTAVGADKGETILSAPTSPVTTASGTQTVKLKWNAPLGAYSYNVWRCETTNKCVSPDGSLSTGTGPWLRVHVTTTTYSDTSAAPTRYIPPTATGTGSTIVNATGAYAPFFQAPPIAVSQLPAAAADNAGQMRRVTDSTVISSEGQTCAGGGSAAALAFSNGTVCKCF